MRAVGKLDDRYCCVGASRFALNFLRCWLLEKPTEGPMLGLLFRYKEIIYNIGALSSYVSQGFFLIHGFSMLLNRQRPHWSAAGFALFTLASIVLMAPYKWDRRWMRVKSVVGMAVFGSVLAIYLFCLLAY